MTNRQPKGTPVGGQFAEGRKPEGADLNVVTEVSPPIPPEDLKATLEAMWQEAEVEYNEAAKDSAEDEENVGYWDGMKAGIGKAQIALLDSGWTPPKSYPENHDELVTISITVNRRNGDVNITSDGKLAENGEFEYAREQLNEVATEIVANNPELFITDPLPRTIELRHGSVSARNYDNDELMLNESDVEGAEFLQNDGAYVYLKLKDGRVVLLDPIDVDVSDPPF